MKDRKLSDLKNDREFLTDAVTFLRSSRKGYSDDDLRGMTGDDIVYDVLEHFRIQSTNEMTMAKDYYFLENDKTKDNEKQSFGRLMYAFDNAKGEGLLDGGGAKIFDYAEGVLTAPTTYATALSIPFTGGAGGAAAQGTKQASLMALRGLAKKQLGKAALVGSIDGAIAGASQYGLEKIKQQAGKEIGEDYDVSAINVGAAAVLGAGVSGAASYIGQGRQTKAAQRLSDTIARGRDLKVKELAEATAKADAALKRKMSREEAKLFDFTSMKILRSIDPALVKEGMDVKKTLLSEDLPDGLIGGFDRDTIKRLGAASYELAGKLGVKPEEGQRITEYLARAMEDGTGQSIFKEVREKYGLSSRQMSAAYAAEVSEAARLLATQKNLVSNGGVKIKKLDAEDFRKKLDMLYDEGMSSISGREATELTAAQLDAMTGVTGKVWRGFKNIEDARRAFMTSQPATTMRNNIFGVAMTGIDMVDQIYAAGIRAVRGDRAAAASTFKNSAANLSYLTKDYYVAEALTTMLAQEAPEKMSRVFLEAAQAEAGVVKNTRLARLGHAANTLNTMSDHVFKRAVIAGTVDRELGKLGNEQLGKSLMEMLEKGTISQLPDDILDKALNESFAFTFQRRFGGKNESDLNKFVGKSIKFVHDTGLTVAIPFPRYIASQAKFISDYTGLTIARRGFTKATDEEYSKFMTGATMFAGSYMIQKDNIEAGREWYEGESYDGQIYNAQAALGPAAMTQWTANLVARIMNGEETKDAGALIREANKILVGTEFRPNAGIADKWVRAVQSGDITPVLDSVGDYFSSYTYPAAVLKDFYGQFDPRSSYLPETRDPTVTSYYVEIPMTDMGFNVRLSTFQRMTRQLPDFNFGDMELPEGVTPDMARSMFKYAGAAARTQYQTMVDPTKGDTGYDMIRFDIFSDGPIRVQNPMQKQLTGLVGVQPKNELQREMSRLQIDPFQLYNPYREKNPALEVLTQAALQGTLPAAIKADLLDLEEYKNAEPSMKKRAIQEYVKNKITSTRQTSEEILKGMQGKSPDFDAYIRGEVQAMTFKEARDADLHWEGIRGDLGYEGMNHKQALKFIQSDTELDDMEKQARQTTLNMIYLAGQKETTKVLRSIGK
jgi:hypothetical protein